MNFTFRFQNSSLLFLFFLFLYSTLLPIALSGQTLDLLNERIAQSEKDLKQIEAKESEVLGQIEELKLERVREVIKSFGLPELVQEDEVVWHSAMALSYSEKHEQAKWVTHVIIADVAAGNVGRSNDFRVDEKIKTGSSEEGDYFLKEQQADGTFKYDGFGFDRGHLAPSADFRWSAKALSESFYYSNMSPQRPDFNRNSWAKLEDLLRAYVERDKSELIVVTGPLLRENLPKVERSVNKISIPAYYYKAVLDLKNQKAIGFLMPNKLADYPLESYAVTIDSLENLTGINFFPALDDSLENKLESQFDIKKWQSPREQADVKPLDPTQLPKKHFNTVQAKLYQGDNDRITVCGTVVSTKLSSKGNVFLNLDKSFPNQIFTVSIFKDRMMNFSYLPHEELMGRTICVEGKVADFNGTPSMVIENEKAIRFVDFTVH
jgi:endonuclease G